MDKIRINNMKFHTFHGVLEEEKRNGQQLEIDIELRLDLEQAGKSDNVTDTINYAEVYQLVEDYVTGRQLDLMEAVAHGVLDQVEAQYKDRLEGILVRIRKYSVPMPGIFDNIEIEMERECQ